MPTLMQRAADWLGERLKAAAGRSVTLQLHDGEIEGLTAWVTEQVYEVTDQDGMTTSYVVYDWSFTRTDLVLSGEQIEPGRGALVIETLDGVEITYEAMPLGNRKAFEWADTSGVLGILHTKKVHVDG